MIRGTRDIQVAAPQTVGQYIAAQPKGARAALRSVRSAIRRALPKAQEVLSYRIPAYRGPAGVVIYFAGWKQHYSLYPASRGAIARLKKERMPHQVAKGTIRFPLSS